MAIISKEPENTFVIAPQGLHQAVCIDVVDKGMVTRQFQGRPPKTYNEVQLRWQLEQLNPENGHRYMVVCGYNNSLHEKAKLRHHLEAWRGRAFTEEERQGFDLERLLGVNCQMQIVHNQKGYAEIAAIVPLGKGMPQIRPENYVRVQDRPDSGNGHEMTGAEDAEESVPF